MRGGVFPEGDQHTYQFSNDMFIKDFKNGKPVAYRVVGTLKIANILNSDEEKLLKFTLDSPQLHVRPHGSNSQAEFKFHKSPLDNYKNADFYAVWKASNISDIYFDASETAALINIKKAIVSLFQYKTSEGKYTENRSSGQCEVHYKDTSHTGMRRMKQNCVLQQTTNQIVRPEKPLQVSAQNFRSTDYEFFKDGSINKIESRDYFHIALEANRDVGGSVDSIVVLKTDGHISKVDAVDSKSAKAFLLQLKNYKSESLETAIQSAATALKANIKAAIKTHKDALGSSHIGTVKSAKAFLNILPAARVAETEDVVQLLKSQQVKDIKVRSSLDSKEKIKNLE